MTSSISNTRTRPTDTKASRRRVRGRPGRLELTLEVVLEWADDHLARTGRWPGSRDGAVATSPGQTWSTLNGALQEGRRGLPGGGSLARLLRDHRGVRNRRAPPPLSQGHILRWA
jgi:hypothetical protein